MPQLERWFRIEIITFYGQIGAAIFFLFLSTLKNVSRRELVIKGGFKETDFNVWTQGIYYILGLYMTMLVVTVGVYLGDKNKCTDCISLQ